MATLKLKKRKASVSKQQERTYSHYDRIEMACKTGCGNVEVVSPNISAVTCGDCVQKLLAPPPDNRPKPVEERRPRGWQFMARYVGPDGKVYEKGKEVTPEKKRNTKNK
jgi:hypothetical protein